MLNNNFLNSILKENTRGSMKVLSLIAVSGEIAIFAVRRNRKQMNFLASYLSELGLRTYFAE